MKTGHLLYFFFILSLQVISAQLNMKISGVNFRLGDEGIVVQYDIVDGSPGNQYFIELKFISDSGDKIIPESTTGDIGKNVKAGMGKTITWDIIKDRFEFSGNLKAVVTATPLWMHLGGPSNAFMSAVVPGLGGYFVEENKLRPAITTAVTLGLISYGIYQKTVENKYYTDYKESYEMDEKETLFSKANNAHHKYFIATRLGAALWIADIAWVAHRGSRNMKEKQLLKQSSSESGLKLNHHSGGVQLGYVLIF